MTPRRQRRHAELRELVAAHALGALDPADAARVDAHLARCASCRAAHHAASEVAALLATSVPAPEPPPALRQRILLAHDGSPATPARPRRARRPRLALAGLAAAAALGGVVAIGSHDGIGTARVVALADATGAPVGSVVLAGDGAPVLLPALPPLPAGRTYQAWAIVGDEPPRSLGLVVPGRAAAVAAPGAASALALSVEPAGGSAQPTTVPVYLAELA